MKYVIIISSLFILTSCQEFEPSAPAESEVLDGPVEGFTRSENQKFLRGDIAFNDEIFTTATGLGPLFIANSCGSCHPGDGIPLLKQPDSSLDSHPSFKKTLI